MSDSKKEYNRCEFFGPPEPFGDRERAEIMAMYPGLSFDEACDQFAKDTLAMSEKMAEWFPVDPDYVPHLSPA
jgi:hypothetical protein